MTLRPRLWAFAPNKYMDKTTFFKDYSNLMKSVQRLSKSESNPFFKSGYVPLRAVLQEAKRVCLENNFIFIQKPETRFRENTTVPVQNTLITELIHKDGEKITGEIEIISKDPTDPQKVGAGLTYMRRYSLTTMFGIEDEDDDGNTASKAKRVIKKKVVDTNPIPPAERTIDNTLPFENEPRYVKPKSNQKVEGQPCPDCEQGKIIKNPKTGKLFCSAKCWTR